MKYLNKFNTKSDYEASASTLEMPNVAYITATTEVIYNATTPTPPTPPVQYVQFSDPVVGQKCATLYGDGTGCTMQDLAAVTAISASDWAGTRQNPTTYTSFDELQFFTGLTEIPQNCFNHCPSLTSIIIPNSVTTIGIQAFYTCRALTSVTIPASVTSIGGEAFATCPGLASITVEAGNATYDSRDNCNAIIESATNKLITGCKNTVIPNSVTLIDESAFFGCTTLTSVVIPNSVTSIGREAFYHCEALTSVTIGNSVTLIDESAFNYCSGMTSVTIGNSVTTIGTTAFGSCKALTSVTIPASVTRIKERGFEGCSNLSSITFEATTPPTINYNGFNLIASTGEITAPLGSEANYYALARSLGAGWKINGETPPVYVQFSDPVVGQKCATLFGDGVGCTEANLGAVTTMRASDWSGTNIVSFNELQYFTGLTSLPQSIFEGCTSLTSVTFPASESFSDVGERAFSGCSSLSTMTFLTSAPPTWDIGAFDELPPGGDLVAPEGFKDNFYILAEQLGGWRVNGEIPVEYVQFADPIVGQKCVELYSSDGVGCTMEDLAAVTTMNASDWSGTNITSFDELGNWFTNLSSLPQGLFKECSDLTSVSIPPEVSNIGADTFRDCTSLTDVDLNIVSRISTNAFYGCTSLRHMFFPDFATIQIDAGAFDGCTALSSLEFMSETLPTVTNSAFPSAPTTGNIKVIEGSESNYYSFARSLGSGWTVNGSMPS